DRGASGGLRRMDAARLLVDETRPLELCDGGRGPREKRTRTDRHDDVVGEAPAELLDALEEERLGALRVIRTPREIHETPALLVGEPPTETVDLVVGPAD